MLPSFLQHLLCCEILIFRWFLEHQCEVEKLKMFVKSMYSENETAGNLKVFPAGKGNHLANILFWGFQPLAFGVYI